jgi:hypothetical protein
VKDNSPICIIKLLSPILDPVGISISTNESDVLIIIASTNPIWTVVIPVKLIPSIFITSPKNPEIGETEVIVGITGIINSKSVYY